MEQNKSTNDTKSHKGTVNTPMKKNLKNQKTPQKPRPGSSAWSERPGAKAPCKPCKREVPGSNPGRGSRVLYWVDCWVVVLFVVGGVFWMGWL